MNLLLPNFEVLEDNMKKIEDTCGMLSKWADDKVTVDDHSVMIIGGCSEICRKIHAIRSHLLNKYSEDNKFHVLNKLSKENWNTYLKIKRTLDATIVPLKQASMYKATLHVQSDSWRVVEHINSADDVVNSIYDDYTTL